MFIVDVSPSMGRVREVEIEQPNGEIRTIEMTNLEWALQFVKMKVQEMVRFMFSFAGVYNGRKTDQCGVILFGTKETRNMVHEKDGGYDHVSEYIPVGTPSSETISKLSEIKPGDDHGDPIDAIIVGIETQTEYLISKKTWTRKMVLLTDGDNPIEVEDWEATTEKMNTVKLRFTLVGIDFDDDDYGFEEEDKSVVKRANEEFYHRFVEALDNGVIGNASFALEEISKPDVKQTKSALLGTVLRLGDVENCPDESIEISVKVSKCTALARPKTWKKFAVRRNRHDPDDIVMKDSDDEEESKVLYAQLAMQTRYLIDHGAKDEEEGEETEEETEKKPDELVEKEELIRGYKYGSSYAPCPDGNFPKLSTKKGIEICGVIDEKIFRRDWAMGEIQYVWADPSSSASQVALSSISEALFSEARMAIARWVTRDDADPKMGVLKGVSLDHTDPLLWIPLLQMPFADDVRKYPFASLERLVNKKGEVVKKHPYLPTDNQMDAMAEFVDAMNLMEAGEKDEDGVRQPWFETNLSYNPAIHRVKQAQFHAAIVTDLNKQPVPPPHPELTKYFNPPRRVLKKAKNAIEDVKAAFNVREVPKRIAYTRKDGHVRARDEGEDLLLLDNQPVKKRKVSGTQSQSQYPSQARESPKSQQKSQRSQKKRRSGDDSSATESETEPESDREDLLSLNPKPQKTPSMGKDGRLPTPPSRSLSPAQGDDRLPGRIVGLEFPLEDFRTNIASGDLVTKAVEDLAFVIKKIVLEPLSGRRHKEMLQCLKELRKVASEEDEIDAWNDFLIDLKSTCLEGRPGNPDFWERVTELGRDISLVSKSEAMRLGGKSNITEAQATEVS
ncbi:SPOC like C-terminal domain-containing protein [Irpex rosettiformis]|uniref:SPOC like C-terminal domain-containing protein n=1 Tax=Irpex rosettiformis TaxID=378272 RepID=A0ACB8U6V6_9APHY|nr:SPOC like C-terminal domain-containing protein [Irpex rosettiformis]